MMQQPQQKHLDEPPQATEDNAREVLRVWVQDNGPQQVVLRTTWDDPFLWGMLMVDVARHVARAYSVNAGHDEREALQRLRAGFDAEWERPTDTPKQIG